MYHIPNDFRSKKSAIKIYQSLRHILFNKKIEDVTISDIKNECGISRSTFYRLFDNPIDVLEMQMSYFITLYKDGLSINTDHIEYFFFFWDKHSDFIYLLSKQQEYIFKKLFFKHFFSNTSNTFDIYLFEVQISIMTGLLCKWVEREKKESIQEMSILTRQILKNPKELIF